MLGMYDDIVEFAELERFMDQKLKNYSSGMQVRLAFSIAIRAQSDILLIDEVLAVGDTNFQRKCFEYFNELKNKNQTVIFVSHDGGAVKRYCDKAIVIDNGNLVMEGSAEEVIDEYNSINVKNADQSVKKNEKPSQQIEQGIKIDKVELLDEKGKYRNSFKPQEQFSLAVTVIAQQEVENPVFRFAAVHQGGGPACFAYSTKLAKLELGTLKKNKATTLNFKMQNIFNDGELNIHISAFDKLEQNILGSNPNATKLISVGWSTGIVAEVYPTVETTIS
jgi:ABC-2 type transport system ATP-binding protein